VGDNEFGPEDRVRIYREPKGTDRSRSPWPELFGAKAVLGADAKDAVPEQRRERKRQRPCTAAVRSENQVKLNAVIP
jgi:hypothetical protein